MRNRLVASALLCSAWIAVVSGCGDDRQTDAPRFAVFVASNEESETYFVPRTKWDGSAIYTSGAPLLTEDEIARLRLGEFAGGNPMLTLELTDDGIRTLADRAEEYVDQELAIVWDYQVVSVPRIKNPLSSEIAIVSSDSLPVSTLEAIAEYLGSRQRTARN